MVSPFFAASVFAESHADASEIMVASGLDGDFVKVTVFFRGTLSDDGVALSLTTSNDGGKTFKSEGYGALAAIPLTEPMKAGVVWTGEVVLHDINDGHPDRQKSFEVRSAGGGKASTLHRVSGEYMHDMVNAIRIAPSTGTFTGVVEVFGEQRVDPSQENLFKVAAFGPSTTITGGWAEAAEVELQKRHPHRTVIVRNFGRNSMWSGEALLNLGNVIASRPHAVVLDFALPDGFVFSQHAKESEDNHREMVRRLREALPGVQIYFLTSSPFYGEAAKTYPDLPLGYEMYRSLAPELGVTLVDTAPLWPAEDPSGALTKNGDGVHATHEANRRYLLPSLVEAVDAGLSS